MTSSYLLSAPGGVLAHSELARAAMRVGQDQGVVRHSTAVRRHLSQAYRCQACLRLAHGRGWNSGMGRGRWPTGRMGISHGSTNQRRQVLLVWRTTGSEIGSGSGTGGRESGSGTNGAHGRGGTWVVARSGP